jgi:hypothetical protein
MNTDLRSDPEAFLYIFGRMLKSEGYPVKHGEGRVKIEVDGDETEIVKNSGSLNVTRNVETFVSHMSSVLEEDEDYTVESLESLGFRFPERTV